MRAWREPLVATAERLRLFALVALGLLALAMAAGLALGARTALAASRPALRTMRLVGAADGFIAGAMTRRLTRTATVGALVGTVAGMVLLALLPAADEQGFFLAGDWTYRLALDPAAGGAAGGGGDGDGGGAAGDQIVTPFVRVGTYPTRNFATLGPL